MWSCVLNGEVNSHLGRTGVIGLKIWFRNSWGSDGSHHYRIISSSRALSWTRSHPHLLLDPPIIYRLKDQTLNNAWIMSSPDLWNGSDRWSFLNQIPASRRYHHAWHNTYRWSLRSMGVSWNISKTVRKDYPPHFCTSESIPPLSYSLYI